MTPIKSNHFLTKALFSIPLLTLSSQAFAFDPSGTMASIFILLGVGGFTIINLCIQALFYFTGPYSKPDFARIHVGLSLLIPLAALVFAISDHASTADLTLKIGGILVGIAFALLPLQLMHSAKAYRPQSAIILAIFAALFFFAALVIPVIALFSLLIAAVALAAATNLTQRLASIFVIIPSAALFLYWLIEKIAAFTA